MDRIFNYVFKTTQERLSIFLYTFLKKYYSIDNLFYDKKFLVARGDIDVALVAHLDTVHRVSNRNCLYYDPKHMVAWSPNGLGADDRAGVYAIIQLVKMGYRPHIFFTHDEESGAWGAKELIKYDFPFETNFIIELDRKGTKEAVFYDCGNKEFKEKILSYGFKLGYGTFSDISIISPAFDVASVNLGIGYYNEHTKDETLKVKEMWDTITRVSVILEEQKGCKVKYNYQEVVYNYNRTYTYGGNYNSSYDYDSLGNRAYPKYDVNRGTVSNNAIIPYIATESTKKNIGGIDEEDWEDFLDRGTKERSEQLNEVLESLVLKDFDISNIRFWTDAQLSRYYELLKQDEDQVSMDWYKDHISEQGNEFIGDLVSDDINVVNNYLEQEAVNG